MQTNSVQIVSSDVVVRSWFVMTSPPLQTNGVQTVTSPSVVRLSKRASVTKKLNTLEKLDDGWPETVEEQSLLLLVWRHHMTKQYIKDVL